jgi:hypothetical protein
MPVIAEGLAAVRLPLPSGNNGGATTGAEAAVSCPKVSTTHEGETGAAATAPPAALAQTSADDSPAAQASDSASEATVVQQQESHAAATTTVCNSAVSWFGSPGLASVALPLPSSAEIITPYTPPKPLPREPKGIYNFTSHVLSLRSKQDL